MGYFCCFDCAGTPSWIIPWVTSWVTLQDFLEYELFLELIGEIGAIRNEQEFI